MTNGPIQFRRPIGTRGLHRHDGLGQLLGRLLGLVYFMAAGLLHGAAAADADGPAALAPPARAGQLALISGSVRMRVERATAWEQATLNTPISSGSALATEVPGRAEVRVGSAALRLAQGTQVVWTEVNDTSLDMDLTTGMLALRLRVLAPGERVQLRAGAVTVQLLSAGAYRFRHEAGPARMKVWVLEGQARLGFGARELSLGAGQQMQFERGIASPLASSANDDHSSFDEFSSARDRRSDSSLAALHVSAEVTGAEALDGHGTWRNESGHGLVWFPSKLPPEWAPYRFGRWRWLASWGWTWIDDAPWGFAPFHYGRWLFAGGRWGWVPGQLLATNGLSRPVFAPALVAFFGDQAGAVWTSSVSVTPVVGWYPLAPGELYWPAYSTQLAYVRALNAGSAGDMAQMQAQIQAQIQAQSGASAAGPAHRFARTAFAASAMPYAAFSSLQDVASNQVLLTPAALAQAPLFGRRLPPLPLPQSLR